MEDWLLRLLLTRSGSSLPRRVLQDLLEMLTGEYAVLNIRKHLRCRDDHLGAYEFLIRRFRGFINYYSHGVRWAVCFQMIYRRS